MSGGAQAPGLPLSHSLTPHQPQSSRRRPRPDRVDQAGRV